MDELLGKESGIQHLTFVEYALDWRNVGTNEEVYLFLLIVKTLLDISEALVSALLKGYKMAVDAIALKQILFKDCITPPAKSCRIDTIDPIAN